MTEPSSPLAGPRPAARPIKGRWQVGLRTLFLLIFAVAAWLGVMRNREKTRDMESRLDVLRSLARELEVDDPGRIAVVKKLDQWMDEDRWEIYLPPGSYRICMATRQVGTSGLPPVMKLAPIAPGRHRLALDQRTEKTSWKGVLSCDGAERLTIEEPKEFPGDSASSSNDITTSQQLPTGERVVLARRQFSNSSNGATINPSAPSDGLMVWIEPDPAGTPAR
jgi:hypothetical protein